MLNTLEGSGYRATFFFDPATLAGRDDLLRRIVASGHGIGLIQTGSVETLRAGNEQLRECTGTVTRLVLSDQAEAAKAAGYAVYSPTLSALSLGTTASGRATRIMNRIENATGTVKLLLGGDEVSAEALKTVCSALKKDSYSVHLVNETACT
jgi:hypothetical protein